MMDGGGEKQISISLEQFRNVPFEIKRLYYIYNVKENERRGFHAHKSLQQILICANGSCEILLDNGEEKTVVLLNKKTEGVLVESYIWHEMFNFSSDAVLIVLASDYYYEEDYIRDYNKFLEYCNNIKIGGLT